MRAEEQDQMDAAVRWYACQMGWYCKAGQVEAERFEGEVDDEYDEASDTYYLKEQWVDESMESEYHYSISGVTHWMPLPDLPSNDQGKRTGKSASF